MQHDWFMYRLRSTYKNRPDFPFKVSTILIATILQTYQQSNFLFRKGKLNRKLNLLLVFSQGIL